MPSTRQDAWTPDEDILLAEIVLRHIREGSTQLKAFEEVGAELSRTAAACGFRWNSYVRKQYKSGIELAKKQRKQSKKVPIEKKQVIGFKQQEEVVENFKETNRIDVDSLKEVIFFLEKFYEQAKQNCLTYDNKFADEKIIQLETALMELEAENDRLMKELYAMEEAYQALIEIMERARKMVVHHGEER